LQLKVLQKKRQKCKITYRLSDSSKDLTFRSDTVGSLRPPRRLADGRLRADGILTRSGVFRYLNEDGSERLEYRPETEVFKAASLESFAAVPVTDDHPGEVVTAANARKYAVGTVGDTPHRDGNNMRAQLTVFDAETIAKMEAGKVELSCGYICDLVHAPGIAPDGTRYDAMQTNIVGNHLAIVDRGRAGNARVRMDSDGEFVSSGQAPAKKDDKMEEQLKLALEVGAKEKVRADELEKKLAEAENCAANAKQRGDSAEAALASEKSGFASAVKARVALEASAGALLGSACCDLTDRQIKVALVKKVDGDEIADEMGDLYVAGRFDGALKRAQNAANAQAETRVVIDNANRVNSDKESDARKAMNDRLSKRGK
jgi:uncharacterized protein